MSWGWELVLDRRLSDQPQSAGGREHSGTQSERRAGEPPNLPTWVRGWAREKTCIVWSRQPLVPSVPRCSISLGPCLLTLHPHLLEVLQPGSPFIWSFYHLHPLDQHLWEHYLVEINEIGECGMTIGVHSQEAVKIPRGIHKKVLEPFLQAIGQGVSPDFLTYPDQKCSLSHVLKEIFCVFSANNSWFKKRKQENLAGSVTSLTTLHWSPCSSASVKGREGPWGVSSTCLRPLRGQFGPEQLAVSLGAEFLQDLSLAPFPLN